MKTISFNYHCYCFIKLKVTSIQTRTLQFSSDVKNLLLNHFIVFIMEQNKVQILMLMNVALNFFVLHVTTVLINTFYIQKLWFVYMLIAFETIVFPKCINSDKCLVYFIIVTYFDLWPLILFIIRSLFMVRSIK